MDIQSQNNFTPGSIETQSEKPGPNKKLITILVIVLLILAAGAGAYYFFSKKDDHVTNSCPTAPRVCANGTQINLAQPNCDDTCPEDLQGDLVLSLTTQGETDLDKTFTVKLTITPASGLGNEFFSTPAQVQITLPPELQLVQGNLTQSITYTDFLPKSAEIKVKSQKEGTFQIKAVVNKQNSGEFTQSLSVFVVDSSKTASWQTYRNDEYGFEVKYPSGWVTKEEGTEEIFSLRIKKDGDDDYAQKIKNDVGGVIYPRFFQVAIMPTSATDVEKMIDAERKEAEAGIGAYASIVKQTTLDGVKAVWLANCVEMSSQQGPVAIKNGYRFSLGLPLECIGTKGPNEPKDPDLLSFYRELDSQYGPILDQILSTFKFTK